MNLKRAGNKAAAFRCALMISIPLLIAGTALAQAPTPENVEKYLKGAWEKKADSHNVRTTLKLNSVRFGKAAKATYAEVLDGIPEGGLVTPAIVDFSVTSYYSDVTSTLRRIRESFVYLDKFGEWAVMTGSARGQDEETREPVKK